jgi:erythromycin esterase
MPIVTWCPIVLLVFAMSPLVKGQSLYNLNFEKATPNGYPVGWEINEGGGKGNISVDTMVAYQGKRSLVFMAQNSPILLTGLRFSVDQVRGKTITITAYCKSEGLEGTAQLFHYDYGKRAMGTASHTIRATTSWQEYRYSFSIDSTSEGEGIVVGMKVSGTGKVNLDGVRIWIGGKQLVDKPLILGELSSKELAWLDKQAIPLPTPPAAIPIAQHKALQQAIGKARMVALGENSHGSGTTFRLKQQLVQFLVEQMHFNILALETPAPEAELINRYVLGKGGSQQEVVSALYLKSWQTSEVLGVIEWMKTYNQTHEQKIQFKGFDVQSYKVALENLTRFAQKHDRAMRQSLDSIANLLSQTPLSDSLRWVAYQKAVSISASFKDHSTNQYQQVDQPALDLLERDAIILSQSIGLPLLRNRRQWMAQNIEWLLEHAPAGSKLILWAANDHVSKGQSVNMGSYLAKQFGKEYLAIGSTFLQGQYSTYGPEKAYGAEPAYLGTYEYYLGKVPHAYYLLDLRKAKGQPSAHWLSQPLTFRTLGVEAENHQFKQTKLLENFDLLLFFQESKPSTYLLP